MPKVNTKILTRNKIKFPKFAVEHIEVELDTVFLLPLFGIDPGYKFVGAAYVFEQTAHLFQFEFESTTNVIDRLFRVWNVIPTVMSLVRIDPKDDISCVIEGGYFIGQGNSLVSLGEARGVLLMSYLHHLSNPNNHHRMRLVAPQSIKKHTLDTIKMTFAESYPDLPKDASAALCCAFTAHYLKE